MEAPAVAPAVPGMATPFQGEVNSHLGPCRLTLMRRPCFIHISMILLYLYPFSDYNFSRF